MGFKFWKKDAPTIREDYKIISKVKKGGKKLDRQQKNLLKCRKERKNSKSEIISK